MSDGAAGSAKAAEVRAIIAALPTCVTREQCDTLAENFVLVQSKGARKRMVRPAYQRAPATLLLHTEEHMLTEETAAKQQRHASSAPAACSCSHEHRVSGPSACWAPNQASSPGADGLPSSGLCCL